VRLGGGEWSRLGLRLRDIPGREFPEVTDAVAQSLQGLWTRPEAGTARDSRGLARRGVSRGQAEKRLAAAMLKAADGAGRNVGTDKKTGANPHRYLLFLGRFASFVDCHGRAKYVGGGNLVGGDMEVTCPFRLLLSP
jgi:hypothetical protein